MSFKKLMFVLLVIIISLIASSWIWIRDYYTNINDKIDSSILSDYATFTTLILSFWGLVLNIILVFLAYEAFKNFDVKKQFHNKQLDLVSELATAISSTTLSNMAYVANTLPNGKEEYILTGYTLSFFEISLAFNYSKFDLMCVRTKNIENTFPFLKYRNNPLLPKSISERLNKLYKPLQFSLSIQKDEMPKKYVVLYSNNIPKDDYSKDLTYEFYKKPTDFSEDSLELKQSITAWFREYGADDLNI